MTPQGRSKYWDFSTVLPVESTKFQGLSNIHRWLWFACQKRLPCDSLKSINRHWNDSIDFINPLGWAWFRLSVYLLVVSSVLSVVVIRCFGCLRCDRCHRPQSLPTAQPEREVWISLVYFTVGQLKRSCSQIYTYQWFTKQFVVRRVTQLECCTIGHTKNLASTTFISMVNGNSFWFWSKSCVRRL